MKFDFKQLFDNWEVFAGIAAAVSGFFAFMTGRKKSSSEMITELENLKIKIVAQVQREVANANTLARQTMLIERLKNACPECYKEVVAKFPDLVEKKADGK
jgi:hypothetical protein